MIWKFIFYTIKPFLTSRLNLYVAQDSVQGCDVEPYTRQEKDEKILERLRQIVPEKIGFDELSLGEYKALENKLGEVELKENPDLVWAMRRVKDASEQKSPVKPSRRKWRAESA